MNSRLKSLSHAAIPLFWLPWCWLIHSPRFSLAFYSLDSVTITHTLQDLPPRMSLCRLQYIRVPHQHVPSAGTRLGADPLGLSVTEQAVGQVRWRGEK